MKAMIFAAGLGTRLRPLTDHCPKALVPVAGRPMLEHVIQRLRNAGFNDLIINIHHQGEQIIEYLKKHPFPKTTIRISDERNILLDTGGGILSHSSSIMSTYYRILTYMHFTNNIYKPEQKLHCL